MRQCEDIDMGSLTLGQDTFVNRNLIPVNEHPDTSGEREKAYTRLSKIASYPIDIENNFHVPESNFDQCPSNLTKSMLVAFNNIVRTRSVQVLLRLAREFRQTCALDCFPNMKEVAQSLLLGVSGVDEKDAKGSTAVAIELAHMFGMIGLGPSGRMQRTSRLDKKNMIVNVDRKTNECTEAFASLAQDRALSLEDKSEFAELVLDVFDRTLLATSDWHTGMNMLQAIFKIYWQMIIKHFKVWLKNARSSIDVSKCYYEASNIVLFCNRKFSRYLWHYFIPANWGDYCDQNWLISGVNVVTRVAVDFHAFIVNARQDATPPVNEHLKMIAGFILMTNDFKDFVDRYRYSDSVGCEQGYYNFAPVWKVTGQNKYVKCSAEQLFQINEKHKYQLLQIYRGSRCHRSYPLHPGKDKVHMICTLRCRTEISN